MKKDTTKVAAESSKSTIEKNLEKLEYPATEDIFVQLDQDKEIDIEAIPNNKKLENKLIKKTYQQPIQVTSL